MANQARRFCHVCKQKTLHSRDQTTHGCLMHLLMTVITLGLWIPFAMMSVGGSSLLNQFGKLRCQTCGVTFDPMKHDLTLAGCVRFVIFVAIVTWILHDLGYITL